MKYVEPVYRPPSEADSLLIQATLGCPHNKCTFCGMYKGVKFSIRSVKDIKEDITSARELYGTEAVHSMFLPDGNTIIMKTDELEEIFKFSYKTFPKLKRITLYASGKILKFKILEDLKRLHKAGLTRLHKGLESGNDEVLKRIQKGADAKTMIETGKRVKEAGIELSEYVLVGIGGKELTKEHAIDTAKVLNAVNPDFIRLRTWVPVPIAPLYKDYQTGKFKLLSPHEALREVKLLIENLEIDSLLLSDHISNFLNISGQLPRDKQSMLKRIDEGLKMDENSFRPPLQEL
ncbi:MAG: radical SAM protein [Planctomycetes bacterium]|nr:radical SAM protein [Planctomycetota bacterium]